MRRALALLGSAIFLGIAPGTLAVYVPWTFTRWRMAPPLLGFVPLRILGGLMIAAGLPVLLDCFARFAIQGLGTPAPVAPTATATNFVTASSCITTGAGGGFD